jgi:LacI family transcriptional regulator
MADRVDGSVRLEDVAKLAGVSLATASRALNGSTRRVSDDLRERVLDAAEALQYTANAHAQAVARGRSDTVGLLVHDIGDPFFSSIAAGVIRSADREGLLVTLASTGRDPGRELQFVAALRGQRARAIIIAGSRVDAPAQMARLAQELASYRASGGRVSMISQNRLPVDTVMLENHRAGSALAQALVELGHRRFAILGGPPDLLTAQDRLEGFQEGLTSAAARLPAAHVVPSDFTRDGGYEAMERTLDAGLDATCVIAVNDVMAVGAMAALRDRKLRCPADFAMAGFDDIVTLRDVTPSLTTVHFPLEEIGATALSLVIGTESPRPRLRPVDGQVMIRESTPRLNR